MSAHVRVDIDLGWVDVDIEVRVDTPVRDDKGLIRRVVLDAAERALAALEQKETP